MNVIISPSGNLYGSEQVLLDYLLNTQLRFRVFIPSESLLATRLHELKSPHQVSTFPPDKIYLLYLKLGWLILLNKIKTVYVNEAGHLKYIFLLARTFRKTYFFMHVRILEDTREDRWPSEVLNNVRVFTISKFIQSHLKYPSALIFDGFKFHPNAIKGESPENGHFKVGIVGRLVKSKGVDHILPILNELDRRGETSTRFLLFGTYDDRGPDAPTLSLLKQHPGVTFMGFVPRADNIYSQIDCLLHLAEQEPLGRIFFEALDHLVPFIGFNSAGIAELAAQLSMTELLTDPADPDKYSKICDLLMRVKNERSSWISNISVKKPVAFALFGVDHYSTYLDHAISQPA